MLALNRFARQLELMGRVPKHRKRKRPVPPARQASAPRIAYLRGLLQMVDEVHAHVRRDLLPAVRPIIEAHNALRPDAMQERIDATGSRTAAEMKRIRKDLERVIPERRISLLAEQNALRVAEHSRKELNRQVRTVANIDVYADPTVLAEHIEAFVEDNVRLVKGLMSGELDDLEGIVLRGARAGLRYEEIADDIVEKFGATKRRAALIARDQVTSLNAELTRIRQQQVGIEQYTWSTVKDERVRKSHRALEGTTQRWDSPPTVDGEKAHPGQPINCRCQAIPDVDAVLRDAGLLVGEPSAPPPRGKPKLRSVPPPSKPAEAAIRRQPARPSVPSPRSVLPPSEPPPLRRWIADDDVTIVRDEPVTEAGVNAARDVTVRTSDGKEHRAIWKPQEGETAVRSGKVAAGTYHAREAAMYELDQELGPGTVVPPTVSRELNGKRGSLQLWAEGAPTGVANANLALEAEGAKLADAPSVRRTFLLDVIAANDDRHGGNVLWHKKAGRWQVAAPDNGLAFPLGKIRQFWFPMHGQELAEALVKLDAVSQKQVQSLQLPRVAAILQRNPGITPRQIRETLARIRSLQLDPQQLARLPGRGLLNEKVQRWISLAPEARSLSAEDLGTIDRLSRWR